MELRSSIFSQKLDRVTFTAYLLGAVLPLIALGLVVERYVFPALTDRYATYALMGVVASLAVLSLASFLVLRRVTHRALDRFEADNKRLGGILRLAGSLSSASHAQEAAATATRGALVLSSARAGFVLMRGEDPGAPPVRLAVTGEGAEKLEQRLIDPLVEMAEWVLENGRPASRAGAGGVPALAAVALPGEEAPQGALIAVGPEGLETFAADELDALGVLAGLAGVALRNADLIDAQRNFFAHVTDMLVTALDSHLGYHRGHGTRVAQYANRVGRELGLDEKALHRLHFSALLHDLGMLKIERHQQMDRRVAARHTLLGARMVARIRLWREIAPIVQYHHEWWDGSGYPEGVAGTEIPAESRIIAVCDAFDTMTSPASYKDAVALEQALGELVSGAGTQFEPRVVEAFCRLARSGALPVPDAA